MIVINLFVPPISFRLQLAAAAPGPSMRLFICVAVDINIIDNINYQSYICFRLTPKSYDLTDFLVAGIPTPTLTKIRTIVTQDAIITVGLNHYTTSTAATPPTTSRLCSATPSDPM